MPTICLVLEGGATYRELAGRLAAAELNANKRVQPTPALATAWSTMANGRG